MYEYTSLKTIKDDKMMNEEDKKVVKYRYITTSKDLIIVFEIIDEEENDE